MSTFFPLKSSLDRSSSADPDDMRIVRADGKVITSSDGIFHIAVHPAFKMYPERFATVFAGKPQLIPTFTDPSSLSEVVSDKELLVAIAVPIRNSSDPVIAALVSQEPLNQRVQPILSSGRTGLSGESYLVAPDMTIVSLSRFEDELIDRGLLKEGTPSALALSAVLPNDSAVSTPTLAAASASSGKTDTNIDGYQDYRGIPVLGAWYWDEHLGVALISEINVSEILDRQRNNRLIMQSLIASAVLIGLSVTGVAVFLGRENARQLANANRNLEDAVTQRTGELQDSQARVSNILQTVPDGIITIDRYGIIVNVNAALAQMFEYEETDLIGDNIKILMAEHDSQHHDQYLRQFVSPEQRWIVDGGSREVIGRKKSGEEFPIDVSVGCGNVHGEIQFTGVIKDITDRKTAEEALAQKEAQLRAALDNMTGGLFMVDKDLRLRVFNDRLSDYYELPKGFAHFNMPLEKLLNFRAERGDYGPGTPKDLAVDRLNGYRDRTMKTVDDSMPSGRVVETYRTPTADGSTVVVFNDVSERRKAEKDLAEAHGMITESMEYASRIQRSLLPPDGLFKEIFADHFMVWDPKDIVGGDMIWLRPAGEGFMIVVADCTGHGAPGAFMTMISNGALDQAIAETPNGAPDQVLARMHRIFRTSLGQDTSHGESDDGLELGLCQIGLDMKTITYADARFSLHIIDHDGTHQELKGDKVGIGYRRYGFNQTFTAHTVDIIPGRQFYLWSDGITDQIGGARQRSFGKRRTLHCLIDHCRMPMNHQKAHLEREFENYRHNEVRRDDITMFGFMPITVPKS